LIKKIVKAKVSWLTYEAGGRKNLLPAGARYCPIVKFNGVSNNNELWSADFTITDIDENNNSIVEFTLFAEGAPFNYLVKGSEFELFEGNKRVAVGSILE